MAAMAGQESETQVCNNCHKDVPVANFTIHEIHCSRNIGVCPLCKESFPKAEMRTHQEQEHAQIVCKCSMKMDKGLLRDHIAFDCPLRPVVCQHCDIELAFCKLQDHEDYCGARTERCVRCNRNIMLRELRVHPIDCEEKAGQGEPGGQAKPPFFPVAQWPNIQTIRNVLQPDSAGESPLRGNRIPETQLPREPSWRNRGPSQPERSRARLEKAVPPIPVGKVADYNLDYLLALSMQGENFGQRKVVELHKQIWNSICSSPENGPMDHSAHEWRAVADSLDWPKPEALLPCEFCERLYPEGELILHQTSCNPASALASFSKRSHLVPPAGGQGGLWREVPASRSAGSGEMVPAQRGIQDSLLIPCEFCGVQLEQEILFHHQDQCDLRPPTAPSSRRTPAQSGRPVAESSVGTESPELPRRRTRHQGELPSQYLEQLQQQKPFQPSPRSQSQVAARDSQLTTPNNPRREEAAALPKARKPKKLGEGDGRTPGRSPRDPVATRYPPSDYAPSTYIPRFPLELPTHPSLRPEGGQSAAAPSRFNNAKAKPWPVKPASPDRE